MYTLKERKDVDSYKYYLCCLSVSYLKIKKGHKMILNYLYGICLSWGARLFPPSLQQCN